MRQGRRQRLRGDPKRHKRRFPLARQGLSRAAPPAPKQATVYLVSRRHFSHGSPGFHARRQDFGFLFRRPIPPAASASDQLNPPVAVAVVLSTVLMPSISTLMTHHVRHLGFKMAIVLNYIPRREVGCSHRFTKMADAEAVLVGLAGLPGLCRIGLVLNRRG